MPPRLTPADRLLDGVSEKQWMRDVIATADVLGVSHYHPHESRRDRAGYPDLTLWGPGGIAFAELKTRRGRVRPEQEHVLAALRTAGADVYVWRPGDMDEVVDVLRGLASTRPVAA